MAETTHCPVCGRSDTALFLERPNVPVHQNLLLKTIEAARAIPRGHLKMRCCSSCGFVFNGAFDPKLLSYGSAYENTQTCSPSVEQYVEGLCRRIIDQAGPGSTIVEVGCGKGLFLRKLLQLDPEARGFGFDPSYVGDLTTMDGRLRFERRFYDSSAAEVHANVVVCRHVIEHVERPLDLLSDVRAAIAASPGARIYFETPDLDWILRNGVVWDLFYEHCSLFNPASLRTAFERTGFEVESVKTIFGDQYLWCEAGPVPESLPGSDLDAQTTVSLVLDFAALEQALLSKWRDDLLRWAATGTVVLWGAGAKGVTYAALVDPDRELMSALVDVNAAKQGHFVPGTGHPIVAPHQLVESRPSIVLVLNPNYVAEIEQQMKEMGLASSVIDLMSIPYRGPAPEDAMPYR